MEKIDGHLHLVRSLAGAKGQGRLTPIGHGRAIWDDGEVIKLIPDGWGDDNFLVEKYLPVMKEEGIDKAVLLQGTLNGYQNYYTYTVVKRYPDRFIGGLCRRSLRRICHEDRQTPRGDARFSGHQI